MGRLNCKLNRNISITSSSGASGSCGASDLSVGGISTRVFLYNIDDVRNLIFVNDARFDDTQAVETINTTEKYYYIDASTVVYNEEQDGELFNHSLTLTINNIATELEDALTDATNSKYLVAFRPLGSADYRMFGWREGASLTYSLAIDDTSNTYTIKLEDASEYSLMSADASNFDLQGKIYQPIWVPSFEYYTCEKISSGYQTGYAIANLVLKQTSLGQALDEDNKLALYSGKPQVVRKYENYTGDVSEYKVEATYTSNATFNGYPVRKYDANLCQPSGQNSISLSSPNPFYSGLTSQVINLTVSDGNNWEFINIPSFIALSKRQGNGSQEIILTATSGGQGQLTVRNNITLETFSIDVYGYFIYVPNENPVYPNGTKKMYVIPTVEGGSEDFNMTYEAGSLSATKQSNGTILVESDDTYSSAETIKITISHADYALETVEVNLTVLGTNNEPVWVIQSQECVVQ